MVFEMVFRLCEENLAIEYMLYTTNFGTPFQMLYVSFWIAAIMPIESIAYIDINTVSYPIDN